MWQIKIQDPSGHVRSYPLTKKAIAGRDECCEIQMRDPTLPAQAFMIQELPGHDCSPYWIFAQDRAPNVVVGDIECRGAHLPENIPVRMGESVFWVEKTSIVQKLPKQPTGQTHWLTQSDSGAKLLWDSKKCAETSLSIYLHGDTGTGKEIIAELIHSWSPRRSGRFIPLNCSALAASVAESELFGHEKGAFTGAIKQRPGALLSAHGGTLFLDEIGDLNADLQVKLLRFLESGEIRPVGSDRTLHADVRILCATHKSLWELVERGIFRQDLYYRLASVELKIPTLHSRPKDIELLAYRFAKPFQKKISPRAMLRLKAHHWPGNVRELRHCIERACGMIGPFQEVLREDDFGFLLNNNRKGADFMNLPHDLGAGALSLQEMERIMIIKALRLCNGHRKKAAALLGVGRSTLFEMLKRHQIQGPTKSFEEIAR